MLWAELQPAPDHDEELGDGRVLATGRVLGWGVGRVVDAPAGWLWRVSGGRIVEGRVFESARAAREAVGRP